MTKSFALSPHNPIWKEVYEKESVQINEALGSNLIKIHHVGSTAIAGLLSKPKVDILAVVKEGDMTILPLEQAGYTYRGEWNIPFKYGFSKREGIDVNLHVLEEGHGEIEVMLTFRDYLLTHQDALDAYASLKQGLHSTEGAFSKEPGRLFIRYSLDKDAFIRKILKEAGFSSVRFMRACHDFEMNEFFRIANLEPQKLEEEKIPFVLYQGTDIVACALVEKKATVLFIAVDENKSRTVYEDLFLTLIKKWIEKEGRSAIFPKPKN